MTKPVLDRDTDLHFPHFVVLKASAGSGKTHTLTERFVQFILSGSVPNNDLRNILAVTFSNNAAREMKERILLWLKSLAFNDPDKSAELLPIVSIDSGRLAEKAETMVDQILDHYPDFQVRTIDSFMTSVFKASAIDFGYNPDFEILMSNDAVMEYAFSLFLRQVREGQDEALLIDTVLAMLNEQQRKDTSFLWDPSHALLEEIKKIYRKLAVTGKEPVIADITAESDAVREKIQETLEDIEEMIVRSGLERNRKSTCLALLSLVREKRFADLIGRGIKTPPVNRVKKADRRAQDDYDRIVGRWSELDGLISRYTACYVRSYFVPYLKVFERFSRTIEDAKRRQGKIFIEDINRNLAEYLNDEIVPDVYFRIGETVFHFLIDEFQDTSPLQWKNLFPLIENALSQKGSAFVVGDTKQAIYGFRDADFTIMKKIESRNPFPSSAFHVQTLDVNFRSRQRILDFSRQVFRQTIAQSDVYREAGERSGLTDFAQTVKEGRESQGYAEVSILERNEDDPAEKKKIQETIRELHTRGFRSSDIAILTQTNEDAVRITGWLNEAEIPFISYSSLDIRRRKITGEIVSLLNFLSSPTDDLAFAAFLLGDIFAGIASEDPSGEMKRTLSEFLFAKRNESPLYKAFQQEFGELWKTWFEGLFRASGYLPLYDLVSEIFAVFRVFEISGDEEATLVKILEVINKFEGAGYNSVRDFLGFAGDGEGSETDWTMIVPKNLDAVHVMTIHKAKGLGFPVVLLVLYEERRRGFDYLVEEGRDGVGLLKITREILQSAPVFEERYREEALKDTVNRLNSLYVGFTRPEEELYVIGVSGSGRSFPLDLLPAEEFPPSAKPDRIPPKKTEDRETLAILHPHVRSGYDTVPGERMNPRERQRGELIHRVLFHVEYAGEGFREELLGIIRRVNAETGFLYPEEEIGKTVMAVIEDRNLAEYFRQRPDRRIMREQEFADREGRLFRMDRVVRDSDRITVLDYKTGAEEAGGAHEGQVRTYLNIIRGVYPGMSVEGVIAYVDRREVRRLT